MLIEVQRVHSLKNNIVYIWHTSCRNLRPSITNCELVVTRPTNQNQGTYKVRNETKRNQRKRNETKSTKTKRNETKSTKWKRNKTKPTKSTKTKRNTMLDYFPHMSQCLSPGEDRIWSPLNKNTMHLFSGSLSFSLSGFF